MPAVNTTDIASVRAKNTPKPEGVGDAGRQHDRYRLGQGKKHT